MPALSPLQVVLAAFRSLGVSGDLVAALVGLLLVSLVVCAGRLAVNWVHRAVGVRGDKAPEAGGAGHIHGYRNGERVEIVWGTRK